MSFFKRCKYFVGGLLFLISTDALAAVVVTPTPSTYTEVSATYSQSNSASGGIVIPYTWSISAGSLPAGVSLNILTGLVSGTPTTAGPFSYTVQATAILGGSGTAVVSGTIVAAVILSATPSTFTEVGVAYSQSNSASLGTAPYTYSVSAGSLPAGTSLNTSTGLVSGTPTTPGAFSYTIRVTDAASVTATAATSGTMATVLDIAATPSTYAEVNVVYSQANTGSGGTAPYTYSVSAGSLPAGTSLNTSTGLVSGTPTTAGAFNYTIRVTDAAAATATASSSGTIAAILDLTATPSTYTVVGAPYSQANTPSGGTAPYTYSVSAGSIPLGLSLNTSTGVVSGTPLFVGAFSYTIRVTDAAGATATATSSGIMTTIGLVATPSTYTEVGITYSQANTASGGVLSYTYSVSAGSLPAGTSLNTSTGLVSGTPTTPGAFNYTIRVTDFLGATATASSSGTIVPSVTLNASPSTYTEVGIAYSQSNTASDGTAPYTYSVSAGSLPAGTSLNSSTGLVSGTPTTPGAFNYTIQVTDAPGATSTASSSGTIVASVTLNATPSTYAEVNVSYSQSNTASNGTAPYTYSVSAGSLPAGTSLNTSTGLVSGTPTTAGAFNYTIQVTDAAAATDTASSSGTIAAILDLTASPSTYAEVNVSYSQTNTVSGGTAPYTYSVSAGSLPAGTSLNTSTGLVSGTPTTAGAFNYTIRVTDDAGATDTASSSGTIAAILDLTASPSTYTEVNVSYSQSNSVSGGTAPYTYSVSAGSLPAGTSLNTSTGLVSGTPTTAGAFNYTIRVTDDAGATDTASSSGTIAAILDLTASPSTYAEVNVSYSQTNTVSGGTAPYTYSVSAGSLPAGTSLNTSTGLVSGTPTTAGAFNYTIRVTDDAGATDTASSSGTIAAVLDLTASPSTYAEVNVSYSQTNTVSGGTAPYTYSVSAGSLPAGTSLNTSTGLVSGTPTTAGAFNYTIRVTDAAAVTATASSSGSIAAILDLTASPSTYTEVNVSYSQTNTVSGGTAPYTYSVSAGSLPAGTSLNTSTGLVSGTPTTAGAFNYTIRVTDAASAIDTASSSGTIAAILDLSATPSTYAEVNVSYSQSNTASGGTTPYTYSVSAGSLPAGTSLNTSTGLVSGTPTTAGAFNYTIRVTDDAGATDTASSSGTIAAILDLTASPSTYAEVNVAYSQSNSVSGGTAPYTYSVSAGSLPAGTSLNISTGTVSGTPITAGAFNYTIRVTDAAAVTATASSSGTIAAILDLTASPSTYTEVNVAYSQSNSVSGGTAPYTYSVSAGSLPAGTSLNTSTGLVSGTPTTAGAFNYTIRVTDLAAATDTVSSSGTIAAILDIVGTPSTYAEVNVTYSQSNTASGGTAPYTYSVSAGSLPVGTSLNTSTGLVSGTPTAGAFNYTIQVTDDAGATATASSSGTIAAMLDLTASPSTYTEVNVAYSQSNTVSGGTAPYTYSVSAGSLPAGTSLNTSTGLVSGTPTTAGAFNYTIRVTDAASAIAAAASSGTIATVLDLTATPSTYTVVNVAYSQSNTASGGTAPYTYSVSAGSLPAGTSLNTSTGLVSGTPTIPGAFSYTIRATDSGGGEAFVVINGIINGTLALIAVPPAIAAMDIKYVQENIVSGGAAPYVLSVDAGILPPGTQLNPTTGTVEGYPSEQGNFQYTIKVVDNLGAQAFADVSVVVTATPDPTEDLTVKSTLLAQTYMAQQLTLNQIDNFSRRLRTLHGEFSHKDTQVKSSVKQFLKSPDQILFAFLNKKIDLNQNVGKSKVWASGAASQANFVFEDNNLKNNMSSITIGMDSLMSRNLALGLAVGYGNSKTEFYDSGFSKAKEYSASGYASYQIFDYWYLDAVVGYGKLRYVNQRWLDLTSDFMLGNRLGDVYYGSLSINEEWIMTNFKCKPYMRVDATRLYLENYQETGGVLALKYDKSQFKSALLSVGSLLSYDFCFKSRNTLTPLAKIEYLHTFDGNTSQRVFYADTINDSLGYSVNLGPIPENVGTFGIGLNYYRKGGFSAELEWLKSFGESSYQSDTVNAIVIMRFM